MRRLLAAASSRSRRHSPSGYGVCLWVVALNVADVDVRLRDALPAARTHAIRRVCDHRIVNLCQVPPAPRAHVAVTVSCFCRPTLYYRKKANANPIFALSSHSALVAKVLGILFQR